MSDFLYQIGHFKTNNIWSRPSWMKIRRFLIELKRTDIYKKYKIVLYGGVLFDIHNTWDVDIKIIKEDIDSYEELENDIYRMNDIAINNHGLLIDVTFVYKEWDENITKTDFYSKNYIDVPYDFIKIGWGQKILNGELTEYDFIDGGEDTIEVLTKYLVKRRRSFPSCLEMKGHERWFKHENSKKFYDIDEFLNDTDVDFFNKTNK